MSAAFPKLTDKALHGLPGEIVRAILPHSEADPAALLVQTLVFFGNCIGRSAHFVAEDDKHHSNLFAIMVGDTSKARKGTSLGRVRRIFRDVDKGWLSKQIVNGLSSGEGLISIVNGDGFAPEIEDEDGAILHAGADKRLLVIESEFSSVLRVMAREGNTLSSVIREAWDIGTLNVITKNNPLRVTDAHISIIGHITRYELQRHLNQTERANGFANRFLFVATRRSKLLPDGGQLADDTCSSLAHQIRKAVQSAALVGKIQRDADAQTLWQRIYEQLSTGDEGMLGAVTSRAEAQVMRLACVYALMDCAPVIRRVHLESAYALWQYCAESARYIFGQMRGHRLADHILEALESCPEGLTQTELNKLFSGHRSSDEIKLALDALCRNGRVIDRDEKTLGRPVHRWYAVSAEEKAKKAEEVQECTTDPTFSASSATSSNGNRRQKELECWTLMNDAGPY